MPHPGSFNEDEYIEVKGVNVEEFDCQFTNDEICNTT